MPQRHITNSLKPIPIFQKNPFQNPLQASQYRSPVVIPTETSKEQIGTPFCQNTRTSGKTHHFCVFSVVSMQFRAVFIPFRHLLDTLSSRSCIHFITHRYRIPRSQHFHNVFVAQTFEFASIWSRAMHSTFLPDNYPCSQELRFPTPPPVNPIITKITVQTPIPISCPSHLHKPPQPAQATPDRIPPQGWR